MGLSVTGVSTLSGVLNVDGNTNLNSDNISAPLVVNGAVDFNSSLDVDGQTDLDDVNVSGVSTLSNDLIVGVSTFFG